MRQNGVRGLFVTCSACGYHAEINVVARRRSGAVVRPAYAL